MKEIKNFINGADSATSGQTFDNINPCTGETTGIIHEAGRDEVSAAVSAAREALNGPWGSMILQQRTELLHAVADGVDRRSDEFLEAECLDTGKPRNMASHIDIPRGAANFRVFADAVKSVGTESFEMPTPDGTGAVNFALRRPKGVIAVISPWNFPLLLMTWKVGPALACGNTVVVKPSEETPSTTTLLGEVMNEAGVPPGVFNVIHGYGPDSAGAYLTEHPDVDAITFTGETCTGEVIMKAAAKGVRDVSFELGGKNPAVVFADCDMDKAIEGCVRSVFVNCGQVCLGTERVFVERPVFDEFVGRLAEAGATLKLGTPDNPDADMGPLISLEHQRKVLSYYERAVAEGAKVVIGGGVPDRPGDQTGGAWIEPTIWTGLPDDASVVNEEIFGPCCHIRPFDTEEEAVALANGTPYGLAASLWTENLSRALRVSRQIECGICWVNSWFLRDLRTPFGGMKQSGIGREGGEHSLEFYTELQNVCIKI
jgi:aminomuconate-semialdehyde/2-hydroxymuconate-6-semialdehyde dehydrogenase